MKIMSGAEPDKRPDYEGQSAKELHQIQHRVLMLNEMLSNAKPNERLVEGDAYDVSLSSHLLERNLIKGEQQISQRCRQVQPKIQKWIQEASEGDTDQMGTSYIRFSCLIPIDSCCESRQAASAE